MSGCRLRSSTASTASRMSAPFLVPAAGKSCTRSTERFTSGFLYAAFAGTDQSAYARVKATFPNDAA